MNFKSVAPIAPICNRRVEKLNIYGKVRTFAGRSLNDCPFRYQGQYEDAETGLYYNWFRYYDPDTGNYISQDPIGLNGGIALYSYVHDPNNWLDIFGLVNNNRDSKTGRFSKNPNPTTQGHSRKTEYPSTYRAGVVDAVIAKKTDENGIIRDKYDRPIARDVVSMEHLEGVSEHWNRIGHDQSRQERNDWYNDINNLDILSQEENSREGATKPPYQQETGCNYSK